jgi:predicted DNA-binding protein with PD1-like motif
MEYRDTKELIFIRLEQNEDLFESLRTICRDSGLKVGVLVSAIGMLKQAELNFYVGTGRYSPVLYPEPMELASMTGNIILQDDEYQFHFHAVLARRDKETVAGHLSKGKVDVTNELVILKTDIPAGRKLDDATGLMALTFE